MTDNQLPYDGEGTVGFFIEYVQYWAVQSKVLRQSCGSPRLSRNI